MTVSNASYLKGIYGAARALGDRLASSDFTFQPVGNEQIGLLIKGFALPFISAGEGIEVPLPLGAVMRQPSQIAIDFQTNLQFMETTFGHIQQFMNNVLASNNGRFDVKVYSGTPDSYFNVWTLRDCFCRLEAAETDSEARTQLLTVAGTLSGHFFGEIAPGPLLLNPS